MHDSLHALTLADRPTAGMDVQQPAGALQPIRHEVVAMKGVKWVVSLSFSCLRKGMHAEVLHTMQYYVVHVQA